MRELTAEVVTTGRHVESLAPLDELMQSFIEDNRLPGGALAVARHGRLVYARGFGYADLETRSPVRPDSIFRIASISKPITAVAIMRLVDEGKLSLDDPAFECVPHDRELGRRAWADPRLGDVTIRHLLQHRGGWDAQASSDPMFQSLAIAFWTGKQSPPQAGEIVRFMHNRMLDFDPGRRVVYSNFGYCVLGRVIEQVTGHSYEQYVQQSLLRPLGIDQMCIGKTLKEERRDKEVTYYTKGDQTAIGVVGNTLNRQVPEPYGAWYLEAMDAHGGWLGSVRDVVRFGAALEAKDLAVLPRSTLQLMLARPLGELETNEDSPQTYYGLGWRVRELDGGERNYWHTGGLPGSSALLVVRHDGYCWAALFNSRDMPDGETPAAKIDPLIHKAVDAVEQWPDCDLFDEAQ
jgi:N-acyl-D-amino-acid deacylase